MASISSFDDFRITRSGEVYDYCGDINQKHITVPNKVGYIREDAFMKVEMEKVTFPASLVEIGEKAFIDCLNLTTINIPAKVSTIKANAFYNCPKLQNIEIDKDNENYEYVNGLLIDKRSHSLIYCYKGLEGEVVLPSSVENIHPNVFEGCSKITSLVLSDNILYLKQHGIFEGLTNLKNLTLPKKIKIIERSELSSLPSLENVYLDDSNPYFSVKGNAIYLRKQFELFYVIPSSSGVLRIEPTTLKIDARLFNIIDINTIIVPKEIDLHEIVKPFDTGIFSSIPHLEHIILENRNSKVHTIWFFDPYTYNEQDAFNYFLLFIKDFYPPQLEPSVKFKYIDYIAYFILNDEDINENWKNEWMKYLSSQKKRFFPYILDVKSSLLDLYMDYKLLKLKDLNELIDLCNKKNNIEVQSILLEYQNKTFSMEQVFKEKEKDIFTDPSSSNYLKKYWTYKVREDGNIKITGYKGDETHVLVPDTISGHTVVEIGDMAFSPMNNHVNDTVKANRENIVSIILPDSITTIGARVFIGCTSLTDLELSPNMVLSSQFYSMHRQEIGILEGCTSLKKLIIPMGIKEIGDHIFSKTPALEELILPSSLTEIGHFSFFGCYSLSKVYIPRSVVKIGDMAFGVQYGKQNLITIQAKKGSYALSYAKKNKLKFEEINDKE